MSVRLAVIGVVAAAVAGALIEAAWLAVCARHTGAANVAAPDSAALDLTGDIDICLRMSMNDWPRATAPRGLP